MKMAKALAMSSLVFFIVALGAGTLAYDKRGMFLAYGPGNQPCTKFDAIRNKRLENLTPDENQLIEEALQYWLSGFYTAWNYFSSDTFDISGGIKYRAVVEQLEKYCERNPKKKIVDAAIVVGHALHPMRLKEPPKSK